MSRTTVTTLGPALGAMLRSDDPKLVGWARQRIGELTRGMTTEDDRARAVGVSRQNWYEWRKSGLVDGLGTAAGRPKSP
jgi:hypothetical protein